MAYIIVNKWREQTMTDFVFGIFGIIGGLLCAVGDILFDLRRILTK